jgi:hypothetical protein
MSVLMEQLGSHWNSFHEICYLRMFKMTRMTSTLHEDQCTFMAICRRILLGIRNVSDNRCRENQNAHFMFNNFFSETRTVYEILSKNVVEAERSQATI